MGNRSSRTSKTLPTRLVASRASEPVLRKKKSRFSFKRSKTKNSSLCLDIYSSKEPDYEAIGFVNDFTPQITSVGVQNGLLRIKLEGLDNYIKRVLRSMEFHVQYKIVSDYSEINYCTKSENKWEDIFFNRQCISNIPSIHFGIRLRSCLYPYQIQIKLTLRSRRTLGQRRTDAPLLAKNIWCPWSDVIEVNVPSLMQHNSGFKVGDWVQFKRILNTDDTWLHGTITQLPKLEPSSANDMFYSVTNATTRAVDFSENIKSFPCMNYVDISHEIDADLMLLVGDRMGVDTKNIEDIYSQLYDSLYNKYARAVYKKLRVPNMELISMAQCVAVNVMDCLCMDKEKADKIHCFLNRNNDTHFDTTLKLMPSREYQINKCAKLNTYNAMDYWGYCDNCMCRKGIYGWMFRCQFQSEIECHGHDICLTCVHDMIAARDKLNNLLEETLRSVISNDCIHIVSCYVIGYT